MIRGVQSQSGNWMRVWLGLGIGLCLACWAATGVSQEAQETDTRPFGKRFPKLESLSTGDWWQAADPKLWVPRDEVVAFALYTHQDGVLKMTAQLFPLLPDESREVRLEMDFGDGFREIARSEVQDLGWSAHFRVENWDSRNSVAYRVRHADRATFSGVIRKDPIDQETIVVASLSCNSSRTEGPRESIVANLKKLDPDLLFFAGDQSYRHTEHTQAWLEWGLQFREVLADRPVITIPDDHDIGQANLWGENGIEASTPQGPSGGYFYPPRYVNMVQRCQTWHLPDPVDPQPIERGISVYFTRLQVGGIDFAILEDRKFKSGPEGKIPKQGPRPDHIVDPNYDPDSIDLPGLQLLGERQLRFLQDWSADWTAADMKCVLSQTAFCGAVHLHGTPDNRLLADLDCNGWPQSGRNRALQEIRRAGATHLCGDQHLAVVVKHGIENDADGPYAFTSPAIVNTIYGRWWQPENEQAGTDPIPDSPLAWTGNYRDGLGNRIRMLAYANPGDIKDERQRGDGFGVARFNKTQRSVTFECWPRFSNVDDGDSAQFPGWPLTISSEDNDGRVVTGRLPTIVAPAGVRPVVQVVHEGTGEILYTRRATTNRFSPGVFADGLYTIKVGLDRPDLASFEHLRATEADGPHREELPVQFGSR